MREKPRIPVLQRAVAPAQRSNVPKPGTRTFAVNPAVNRAPNRRSTGLGNIGPKDFAAQQGLGESLLNVKTPMTCVEPGCFRLTTPGPQGNAYYKRGGIGPYCGEHWSDDRVCHPTAGGGTCCFGARYDDQTVPLMEDIITVDLPAKINIVNAQRAAQRQPPLPLTYDFINAAFKTHPKLRHEAKCPNCGQIAVWWPDARKVFPNIPGVVA